MENLLMSWVFLGIRSVSGVKLATKKLLSMSSRGNFHKFCCYVCKENKIIKYNEHPFWRERHCPAHDSDGTHKCCSCERLEAKGANYVMLEDRRWLCLECMESAVMDTWEAQPLQSEIRGFFEGLHMKIGKEFPFLLVEKPALNQAYTPLLKLPSVSLSLPHMFINKQDYEYEEVTRGICLSEPQNITSVSKRPRMGPNKQLIGMATVRNCASQFLASCLRFRPK